jgi:ABC-type multidrug transport system ATPase subunit
VTALVARGLTKRYGDVNVVDRLDLTVERGELYGFLGPNGAGKTTTIRMALGLIVPSGGEVDLLGERMSARGRPSSLARTGAMIEEPALYKFLSGRRNLEVFAKAGVGRDDVRRRLGRIDELLEIVGLTSAAKKRVKAFSQGMRQRLGLAVAMLGAPEILVLDEPTNGLDPSGMREIRQLLQRLTEGGTTVFVSSHLLAEVEAMCDRVGVLSRGRLVAEGPPSVLRGAVERVRLDVDDVARARGILAAMPGVELSPEDDRQLRIRLLGDVTAARVNASLVSGGVEVSALVPERESLEDVFLELVGDGDVQG